MRQKINTVIILCVFFFIFCADVFADSGLLRVHIIDVGHGDAIFIEMPEGETVLIDAGTAKRVRSVLKYLKRRTKKIDVAILTHPHKDHFAGFPRILKKYPVGKFYFNGDTRLPHEGYWRTIEEIKKIILPQKLSRGDELLFSSGKVKMRILNPGGFSEWIPWGTNNEAIVSLLSYGEISFLFTGDIHEERQDYLLNEYEAMQKADCIQIPHHGISISDQFADTFRGKLFFLTAGKETNKYCDVYEEQLNKIEGEILKTSDRGSFVLESDGKTIKVIDE